MTSIRGATTVINDNKEEILLNTKELLQEIIKINKIDIEDIISIFFTATNDITKEYPAVAAREIGILNASLMCMDELYIEGSLPKCIRVMVNIETNKKQKDMKHIYLKEAIGLRPDLNNTIKEV